MSTTAVGAGAGQVVVRYRDGRMTKGVTQDFFPGKVTFHVQEGGEAGGAVVEIPVAELKAVFFVKSYEGDSAHETPEELAERQGQGRRMQVTFEDGEVLDGYTVGYNKNKPGFFLVPADPESNNRRVFVVNAAVTSVAWGQPD